MANILVVDDDPKARELLAAVLGYLGYGGHRLKETEDGAEALNALTIEKPDLIIADLLMPTMDGFEFVRRLREMPDYSRTPVVFYTASYLESEARQLANACGVTHIITKPAEPEQILNVVENVLGTLQPPVRPLPVEEFRLEQVKLLTSTLLNVTCNDVPRLRTLVDAICRMTAMRSQEQLLNLTPIVSRSLLGARFAFLAMKNLDSMQINFINIAGLNSTFAGTSTSCILSESAQADIYVPDRPVRKMELNGDPTNVGLPVSFPPVISFLTAPLASESRIFGWLCLANKIGDKNFTQDDEDLAGTLGFQAGNLLELHFA